METKYGHLLDESFDKYKDKLIDRVYKILPMKEEKSTTLNKYMTSLISELVGAVEVLNDVDRKGNIVSVIFVLENLIEEQDKTVVKREIFKAIDTIKKL